MNLAAVLTDLSDALRGAVPNEWAVLREPAMGREAWHPPAVVIEMPFVTFDVTMGSDQVDLDVSFVLSPVDADDNAMDFFLGLADTSDDDGVLARLAAAESDWWDELYVSTLGYDDNRLLGSNLYRAAVASVRLTCP